MTEFWESQEAFERFSRAVIMPLMQQLGVRPGSPPQYLPIDNVLTR